MKLEPLEPRRLLAGASLVVDLNPNGVGSNPQQVGSAGDLGAFFVTTRGETAAGGFDLWVSDGTKNGTRPFADDVPPPAVFSGVPEGPLLDGDGDAWWQARDYNAPGVVRQLYRSDGTPGGAAAVPDGTRPLAALGDEMFYLAAVPGLGEELYLSDNTAAGGHLVRELAPGAASGNFDLFSAAFEHDGYVYFSAGPAEGVLQLWRTDGTAAGTARVAPAGADAPLGLGPQGFTAVGAKLFFYTNAPNTNGPRLWVTDGTTGGTVDLGLLAAASFSGTGGGGPDLAAVAGGTRVVFHNGRGALYASDGTPAGTTLLANAGFGGNLAVLNGLAYLANAANLYRTDGTPAGTTQITGFSVGGGLRPYESAGGRRGQAAQ